MNTDRPTTILRQVLRAISLMPICAPFLISSPAYSAPAGGVAAAFRQLSDDTWITRKETLSSLGFTTPLVLASNDSSREIYLPVPANVPLSDAALNMRAGYLRADGGRTTMVLAVDTYPAAARSMTADQGDAGMTLGIDGAPRANGFVKLGVNWTTMLAGQTNCSDPRTPGNVLRVAPESSFSYRYDSKAIADLRTAWGALPAVTAIMVGSKHLSAQSYDTAWRIGVALERAGKHSTVTVMPAIGDSIDLGRLNIPAALRSVPAFAALTGSGRHTLKDQAEIGALLALGQNGADAQLRGDIVVGDPALLNAISTALNALQEQLRSTAPDAVDTFREWRKRLEPDTTGLDPKELRLVSAFGRPVILVAPQAGANFAGLFDNFWRNISGAPALTVRAVHRPHSEEAFILLKNLGGVPGSFDVMSRADWTASFDIAEVASDGRVPSELVLDVSAAPGAGRTPPVVSVSLNDVLLGAKHLQADGRPERIVAKIPANALAAQNQLKVAFVRQPSSDNCRETPQAFPVAVLASSHLKLGKARTDANFTGMVRRFAGGADIVLPQAYLAHADSTLQNVIMLAASTGLPPANSKLVVAEDGKEISPGNHFLALDVPLKESKHMIEVSGNTLVLNDSSHKPLLDVSGLNRFGALEVVKVGGKEGVVYRSVGPQAPVLERPFQLSSGNVAAVSGSGLLSEINTDDTAGRDSVQDAPRLNVSDVLWWAVPLFIVALFIMMLVLANRVRRRHLARQEAEKHTAERDDTPTPPHDPS
ncbi:hypothetical protein [Herbaspirillum sp. NPDC101397]|uniref:hypothetical protein n=1 Tax=Herbaspirillum sp. NPDC101397 TaxID=3364006 RepID=UPI00383A1CDD